MTNFEKWDKEFRLQNLYAFNHNANGLLWLKVRAICRGKQISRFVEENNLKLLSSTITQQNIELFDILERRTDGMDLLDNYLRIKSHEWYAAMGVDENRLKEDLYKVRYYTWGGDQNNSLDKHFVSKYVKVISSYDDLIGKQREIADNAWNYVQTSWYNNWTSYLIESLFKKHTRVVSAVGEIKSVDFFIDGNPIDLKVTFFPNQFMDEKIKERLGKKELSWLKAKSKELSVTVDNSLAASQQMYILTEKLSEYGHNEVLETLRNVRRDIILEARKSPMELMTWLYANQGEMRFGAENRIYVVLVDASDMSQSWKMKRAFSLIEPVVKQYLNGFGQHSLKEVCFSFKKNDYRALADTVFVIKE